EDPTRPNYLDLSYQNKADHAGTDDRAKLLLTFQNYAQKVQANVGIAGTPKDPEERRKFYEGITKAITHCIAKIRKMEKENPDKAAKQKAKMIQEFLGAASHCGPRQYLTALAQYQEIVMEVPPTFKNAIYQILAELRTVVFDGLVPNEHESIMYSERLLR